MLDKPVHDTAGVMSAEAVSASADPESLASEQPVMVPIGVRFEHPTYEEALHFTRDFAWGDRFIYGKMFAHAGNIDMACYCIKDLVESFDAFSGQGTEFLASQDMLIDIEDLVGWCAAILGDQALSRVLDERVVRSEPLAGQIDTVISVIKTRYKQYCEVLERNDEQNAKESSHVLIDNGRAVDALVKERS